MEKMFFDGYENYLMEQVIDLSRYTGDNSSGDAFHDNFFKEEGEGGFFDEFNVKTLFSVFAAGDDNERNGLIERLQDENISHVLLVIPQKFITDILNKQRKQSKTRIRPREFTKEFIDNFTHEFNSNDIVCSLIVSGSHHKRDTEDLEEWFNTKELQKSLNLKQHEAYLLGFKQMKIKEDQKNSAIYLSLNRKSIALPEECSMLIGNNAAFKYHISSLGGIVKITNNSIGGYIDFDTENIDLIKSNNRQLQEEHFDNESFEEFDINVSGLEDDDIDITFDKTTIMLSNTANKAHPARDTTRHAVTPTPAKTATKKNISTDSDEPPHSTFIDLKNKYLVHLNRFITPYEDDLTEVHYHLVKVNHKLILVGGSQIDKKEQPIAKVVAHISQGVFEITNLSPQAIEFTLSNEKVMYKIRKTIPKPQQNHIDTDEPRKPASSEEVSIQKGESYSFSQKIEFSNSAICFSDDGVEVYYTHFTIGSFNNKLEFGRRYYNHFSTGNIIDSQENLDSGGRVYEDGSKKILGSTISSQPLMLNLEGDSFTLTNAIKPNYTISLNTPSIHKELAYEETYSISKNDLLSLSNTLSINRDGMTLVEISVIQN